MNLMRMDRKNGVVNAPYNPQNRKVHSMLK